MLLNLSSVSPYLLRHCSLKLTSRNAEKFQSQRADRKMDQLWISQSLTGWTHSGSQLKILAHTYDYQRGRGGRDKVGVWEEEIYITIYKINTKDLLYSTGNYAQYLVITYHRKESETEYIYVCVCVCVCVCVYIHIYVFESLCCIPETHIVSQLYFNFQKLDQVIL